MRRVSLSFHLILLVFAVLNDVSHSNHMQSKTLEWQRGTRSGSRFWKRWRNVDDRSPPDSLSRSRNSAVREWLDGKIEVPESQLDGEDVGMADSKRPGWPLAPRYSLYARLRRRNLGVGAKDTDSNAFPRQLQRNEHKSKWDQQPVNTMRKLHARAAHFQDFQLGMGPW